LRKGRYYNVKYFQIHPEVPDAAIQIIEARIYANQEYEELTDEFCKDRKLS
jgi:hypothetical protein